MEQLVRLERELVLKIHQIVVLDKDCSEFNRLPGLLESLALVRQYILEGELENES